MDHKNNYEIKILKVEIKEMIKFCHKNFLNKNSEDESKKN